MGGTKGELVGSVVQGGIFTGTSVDLSAARRAQQLRGGNQEPQPTGGLLGGIPLEVRAELLGDPVIELVMGAFPGTIALDLSSPVPEGVGGEAYADELMGPDWRR